MTVWFWFQSDGQQQDNEFSNSLEFLKTQIIFISNQMKPPTIFQSQYYFDYLFLQLRGFVTDWSCKLWNFWQGLLWQCQDNVLLICDMRKVFLPERNYYYPMAFKRKIPYGQTSAKLPVIMSLCHCHQVIRFSCPVIIITT